MSQRNRRGSGVSGPQLGVKHGGAGCPLTAMVVVPGVGGRTQARFNQCTLWGLGISGNQRETSSEEETGTDHENKPEKFGPGQSFVVGVCESDG